MEDDSGKISEIMNLIGYGLAKFDMQFVKEFGCRTKSSFYQYVVDLGLAKTIHAVSNRQDSFDPYFDNGRRGWFQRNQREHIKLYIDSLFGSEDVKGFANITKLFIQEYNPNIHLTDVSILPTTKSKFKLLQETGRKAEIYFMNNYHKIPVFTNAQLEDARLWGDGYDFQLRVDDKYFLTEVKGIKGTNGSIRLTQNEYNRALEYADKFMIVVVSNLDAMPKMTMVSNPGVSMNFTCRECQVAQKNYYSDIIKW